ncbi:MAG: glycosyl transferase [Candidatus Eremiobacter antarcticus]|nr:glycosyltransferase family 9 protein [Candidatus Eremiobacteraeota bacterium]MBC5807384.1 glycosyltransferase family 9 protein [Candidatus Eremiobacteraeota bacterium]PZR63135.1 MAG: glycosyl transferase [Candidatus Eremiobacter sp. RRmetagenome_bin22]
MKPSVLIARQDNNGDVLLTGPAVRAVAAGARRLTYLCGPGGQAAAELLPGIDELIVEPAAWIDARPQAVDRQTTLAFVDRIAAMNIDEAFILTSFHQSPLPLALLLRMASVPFIAATSVDYPGSLLDVRHAIDDDVHEVERSLSLVATRGYALPPNDDGRLAVTLKRHALPPLMEEHYVVVHPGATVPARAWSPRLNAELVEALVRRGDRVVVTGSASEKALTTFVAGTHGSRAIDLGGRTTLASLATILRRARALVVGNTGAAHLAAAVGTPVVSIFPPTIPCTRFHPWKVPHVVLGVQDIPCSGCRARECPLPGQPCINSLRVRDVLAALDALSARRSVPAAL